MAQQTKGYCKYCGKEMTRSGMVRHLAECRKKHSALGNEKDRVPYLELVLYGTHQKNYWLIIQMKETAKLSALDQFIRDIWVECCGHLSAFYINGQTYENQPHAYGFGKRPQSAHISIGKVLAVGTKAEYEYDFGSTTDITIEVLDRYEDDGKSGDIVLLSRNNPPAMLCGHCGKNPAKWIDVMGWGELWCDECIEQLSSEDSDEAPDDDALMPVCNSPRMGVCGYSGSEEYGDYFRPDVPAE